MNNENMDKINALLSVDPNCFFPVGGQLEFIAPNQVAFIVERIGTLKWEARLYTWIQGAYRRKFTARGKTYGFVSFHFGWALQQMKWSDKEYIALGQLAWEMVNYFKNGGRNDDRTIKSIA